MTRDEARAIRARMQTVAVEWDDKTASENVLWYPRMRYNGELIPYKTRIYWNGGLKMAAADLWDTAENNPDNAPALWTDIDYINGIKKIKDNASAADAFALGEYGWWDGGVYESLMNGNVFTPVTAPTAWRLIE